MQDQKYKLFDATLFDIIFGTYSDNKNAPPPFDQTKMIKKWLSKYKYTGL